MKLLLVLEKIIIILYFTCLLHLIVNETKLVFFVYTVFPNNSTK
jgi:hypothetical protein